MTNSAPANSTTTTTPQDGFTWTRTRPATWLAAVCIAAPLADALASVLHPALPADGNQMLATVAATERWYAMSLVSLLAAALVGIAFVTLAGLGRKARVLSGLGLSFGIAGVTLMAAMQGFKLFLPTLADTSPEAATAVGAYLSSAAFAPMIAGFVLRLAAWILIAAALLRAGAAPWPAAAAMALGAIAAFILPAGPDGIGWLVVAGATAWVTLPRSQASEPNPRSRPRSAA